MLAQRFHQAVEESANARDQLSEFCTGLIWRANCTRQAQAPMVNRHRQRSAGCSLSGFGRDLRNRCVRGADRRVIRISSASAADMLRPLHGAPTQAIGAPLRCEKELRNHGCNDMCPRPEYAR